VLLEQVQAFLEVARSGSFSRAADVLFVSQPAVTARIQALERQLGARLFVRSSRGMRLTDAGEVFWPYAERALRVLADGRHALADVDSARAGRLAVGAASPVSVYLLPQALKRFVSRHPRITVCVRTGDAKQVLELVLSGDVQVAVNRTIEHADIEATQLYEDTLVLVVAPHHPFARRRTVELAEVASERLISFDHASSYHELTRATFARGPVAAGSVMELDSAEAAKRMVEEGLGVAILPSMAVARELRAELLTVVDIADAPPVRRGVDVIRRRDSPPPSAIVSAFLTELMWTLERWLPDTRPGGCRVEDRPERMCDSSRISAALAPAQ
jgi:DNA-binding transcriptional LysR family regulator